MELNNNKLTEKNSSNFITLTQKEYQDKITEEYQNRLASNCKEFDDTMYGDEISLTVTQFKLLFPNEEYEWKVKVETDEETIKFVKEVMESRRSKN